jgi:hypothetical protein
MDFVTFIGTTGAGVILFAFIMNQIHRWKDEYFIYDFFNLIGSGLLIWYSVLLSSMPFFLLNVVWAFVSVKDIIFDIRRNTRKHEKSFYKKWMQ